MIIIYLSVEQTFSSQLKESWHKNSVVKYCKYLYLLELLELFLAIRTNRTVRTFTRTITSLLELVMNFSTI